jgi:hypothetical protein
VARLPDWAEGWNKRATVLYLIGEYDRSLIRVILFDPSEPSADKLRFVLVVTASWNLSL